MAGWILHPCDHFVRIFQANAQVFALETLEGVPSSDLTCILLHCANYERWVPIRRFRWQIIAR